MITSTTSNTPIACYYGGPEESTPGVSEIEIDGVVQPTTKNEYLFETTGEHVVKYTLTDTTAIPGYCFASCYNIVNMTIPNSVTSIGNCAFIACSSLTNITIPDSVTSIGNSAFMNCSSLASMTIGSGVTSISERNFKNCSSLTSVIIPDNITSIMSYAFEDCSGLTSITTLAVTPPTLNTIPFYNTNNCPIYVPAASVDAYKAAWTYYSSRIQAIPTA